jgi:hypothetical protein
MTLPETEFWAAWGVLWGNLWGSAPLKPNAFPKVLKENGRHEETQTPDLYRVNFDLNNLKPFVCLTFPFSEPQKRPKKGPSFGDELVTSFSALGFEPRHSRRVRRLLKECFRYYVFRLTKLLNHTWPQGLDVRELSLPPAKEKCFS